MNAAPTAATRARLGDIRDRTKAARGRIAAARTARDAATKVDDQQAAQAASMALEIANGELSLAQELEAQVLSSLAGVGGFGGGRESFADDPNMCRELESLASSSAPIGSMNLGPFVGAEELAAQWQGRYEAAAGTGYQYTGAQGRTEPFMGVVPQLERPLSVLDLFPTMTMSNKFMPYVVESGSMDTAAETAETAIRPMGEAVMTDAVATARTIGHYLKLPREQMLDLPGLVAALDQRLIYGVRRRLEAQVLAGDGLGENILGILAPAFVSLVGSVAFASGANADAALDGITNVMTAGAVPSGIVANPTDWARLLKLKTAGSGAYLNLQGPFAAAVRTLWGVPVVPSPAIPPGKLLVGDFGRGGTLLIREGVNLRMSDADQDDFVRARVTVLGEMRAGVAWWQPSAFCVVNLQ